MARTNQIGVRFDKDLLEVLREDEKCETPQQSLNFLSVFYRDNKKEGTNFIKEFSSSVVLKKNTPKSYEMRKVNTNLNEFSQCEESKESESNEYDFSGKKFFVIEEYTKYPLRDIPKGFIQSQLFLKEKKESDNKIRVAWLEFQKNK